MFSATHDATTRPLMDKWGDERRVRFVDSPLRWVSNKWAKARVGSRLLMFLTCVDEDLLEEFAAECSVRDDIKLCLTEHSRGSAPLVVRETVTDVLHEQSYDMTDALAFLREKHTYNEWEVLIAQSGLTPAQIETARGQRSVLLIPRFVAASIVSLKAKFGALELREDNVLLIQREYLRVSRDANVRACDVELHRQHVINGFFSEDVLNKLGTVRTRIPSWMRAAYGRTATTAGPIVC